MNNAILYWNAVLLEASRRDFTPGFTAAPQQGGPTRTSRAMAIVHLAMHDALIGIADREKTYLWLKAQSVPTITVPTPTLPASVDSAVRAAAFNTLKSLYPAFEAFLVDARAGAPRGSDPTADENGRTFGRAVADALLAARANDGANGSTPYTPAKVYGRHDADPFNPQAPHVTPHWGGVRHFTTGDGDHAPQAPFPGRGSNDFLTNPHYRQDYEEVRDLGSRGRTNRTPEQTMSGQYWGYDGAPELGVPPRLYNQIVRELAISQEWDAEQCARRFMLANVAMADAGIDAWHWKYVYDLWRPVVAIRHASRSCGPDAVAGVSSIATPGQDVGDPFWAPLGLPRTNQRGAGPATPQFPAYPSGHATFGAAMFQVLQRELTGNPIRIQQVLDVENNLPPEDARTSFSFVSDEQDGKALDADGSLRTRHKRKFQNFAHAVFDNSISRVYLGVHWRFDGLPRRADQVNVGGVPVGLTVGNRVFDFFD